MGFTRVVHVVWLSEKARKSFWMAATPATVAQQYAPSAWWKALVPPSFDGLAWLNSEVLKLWLDRACVGRLPRWNWAVGWPSRSELSMEVSRCSNSKRISECL